MKPLWILLLTFLAMPVSCWAVVAVAMLAGGCMNAGYDYEVTSVAVDGALPPKGTGYALAKKPSCGYWDFGAMSAIERLSEEKAATVAKVEVAVNRTAHSEDSPLWARIPSLLTLTALPLYAKQNETYEIELKSPDGNATLSVAVSGHGLVSFFPTGLLPIPGWFMGRDFAAGGEAFISGDCGMSDFVEKAIEEATYDWLKARMTPTARGEGGAR